MHVVHRRFESLYICSCGKRFSALDLPHYSLAVEGNKLYVKNRNRANSHARMANRNRAKQ